MLDSTDGIPMINYHLAKGIHKKIIRVEEFLLLPGLQKYP
jgi:hypothetical protein